MALSQNSPRTSFNGSLNSSTLVRLLAGLDIAEVDQSKQTFAERLSQWVEWTDAISLSDALKSCQVSDPSPAKPDERCSTKALTEEVCRLRAELADSVGKDSVLTSAAEHGDASTWRRQYLSHQQAMETRIGPLRERSRAALSAASASLGRLAALDAVLDKALLARERQLLSTTAGLLEKHFARLRKAATQAQPQPGPAAQRQSTSAIAGIVQQALLAELELRLQPIEGMIQALVNGATEQT